jgi:hypothetical protein
VSGPIRREDIDAFAAALRAAGAAIVAAFAPLRRLADVVPMARQGVVRKSDSVPGGIGYEVHGAGCAITDRSGREIDVDFLPDGTPIFDVWRLRTFVESTGRAAPGADADVLALCRDMVSSGLLTEPKSGWFAPSDGP